VHTDDAALCQPYEPFGIVALESSRHTESRW